VRVGEGRDSASTVVLGLVGLGLWVLALRFVPGRRDRAADEPTSARARASPLALALFASCATWYLSADGLYTRWNLITWAIAVGSWLWAFMPPSERVRGISARTRRRARLHAWTAVAVFAVLAVGIFFRFHDLQQTPREPTSDHAEKLLDIADVRGGMHPVFFPRNTGREPLQFYVSAALVEVGVAPTFEMLKLGTAVVGALGILGVLLLAWELGGLYAGLLAAALFSVAQWPVSLARDGLRHTYAITASAFALWLLFRYLRTRSRRDLLLCGVALGIGLHGYTAFRVVPAFAAAVVALASARQVRRMLAETGILLGTVAVTTLPLLRYSLDHPDLVWFRTLRRIGSSEAPTGDFAHAAHTLVSNVGNAALAFTWRGESSEVALVRFDPFLDVVSGAAFLAGLLLLGERLLRRPDVRPIALAAALPVLSLSSILNLSFPNENPSAARMGPVAPVVFAIAALALAYVVARLAALPRRSLARAGATIVVAGAIGLAAADNYVTFFRDFDRQYRAFIPNTTEAVSALDSTGIPREREFMLPFVYWMDPRNVGAALGEIDWADSNVIESSDALPTTNRGALVFLLNVADRPGRDRLREAFPTGSYRRVASTVGKDFALFVVPS
jgi:4-amino-4-deoxy-L-arabinose transferase-like glycosyltransferase